jgi:transposase InsO family protein
LLPRLGCQASMGDVGACWDNAVVERFFGSIKHDWLFKVPQPTWINRQLNLKTPLEKCPVGVDQNTAPWSDSLEV